MTLLAAFSDLKHHGQPTQRRRLAGKSVNTWVCRVNLCCCCNNQERQLDSSTVMAALHRTLTGAHNDEPCTSESSTPGSTRSLTPRWPGIYKTLTAHKPRYYVIVESVLNFSFFLRRSQADAQAKLEDHTSKHIRRPTLCLAYNFKKKGHNFIPVRGRTVRERVRWCSKR